MPFFSIIVVSYNAEMYIKQTIESVLEQNFSDYEIIVKDALSNDDTLKMIPDDPRIKIFSCKDSGIYDGMNQAIDKSTGKYLCFLNCGDLFYNSNVLKDIYAVIENNNFRQDMFFYGNYVTKGNFTQTPKTTTRKSIYRSPLCHQTMFVSRTLFQQIGFYRNNFRILADYDFTVHCFCAGIDFCNTGVTVCEYLGDGVSTQKKHRQTIKNEYKTIRKTYFSFWERMWFGFCISLTLPKLRIFIASEKAPKFINKMYFKFVNRIKKG